jgi:hypothetical protein
MEKNSNKLAKGKAGVWLLSFATHFISIGTKTPLVSLKQITMPQGKRLTLAEETCLAKAYVTTSNNEQQHAATSNNKRHLVSDNEQQRATKSDNERQRVTTSNKENNNK